MILRFQHFTKLDTEVGFDAAGPAHRWLLGSENADGVFAGFWKRTRQNDIEEQVFRWHDADEVELIIRGRLHVQLADESQSVVKDVVISEGDLFYIGAGVRHRADSVGDECVGLLVCPKAYSIESGQPSWSDSNDS